MLIQKKYPNQIVDAVVLVTSFGSNSSRNKGGGRGGNKDMNKQKAIVSLHLAAKYDNDSSDDEYFDDDDELVKSF